MAISSLPLSIGRRTLGYFATAKEAALVWCGGSSAPPPHAETVASRELAFCELFSDCAADHRLIVPTQQD